MGILLRTGRVLSLILFAVLGTSALMYSAPGYFADAREMDTAYATGAQTDLTRMRQEQGSLSALLLQESRHWIHGDLGKSRQFGAPVSSLLRERAARSGRLLVSGIIFGWMGALLLALPFSMRRSVGLDLALATLTAILLALPVGVLAVFCLLTNGGGPVTVLAVVVTARDLKIIYRILQQVWRAPHILHAHAQGFSPARIVTAHLWPGMRRDVISLAVMSFTWALSAIVPVEVVFDVPGLGQLAWSAAMNRDLPVLVAVTALISACVGIASLFVEPAHSLEGASCA